MADRHYVPYECMAFAARPSMVSPCIYVFQVPNQLQALSSASSPHIWQLFLAIFSPTMAPAPPEGLDVPALIKAKGAQLKFWIVKTNETAGEKVLKVSGTVDHLRTNLAQYYGLDLTVIPRSDIVTAPTVDEGIRDRQWADLEALGVEWRNTVSTGGIFKLIKVSGMYFHSFFSKFRALLDVIGVEITSAVNPILSATQNENPNAKEDIPPTTPLDTSAHRAHEQVW